LFRDILVEYANSSWGMKKKADIHLEEPAGKERRGDEEETMAAGKTDLK
jgi:hypothetical protein